MGVISDVVQKVGVGVNEILDEHGIGGSMKEKAMDHLDNKLSKMLEEISEEKEEENEEETEMDEAEDEVRDFIDGLMEQLENSREGFDITDEVSKVDKVVAGIYKEHGIKSDLEGEEFDEMNKELSMELKKTLDEKKVGKLGSEVAGEKEFDDVMY